MICEVQFSKRAKTQIDGFSNEDRTAIFGWIVSNLQGCYNPRSFATTLQGELGDYPMYSVGKYNLYCLQEEDRVIILSIEVDNTASR